MAYGAILGQRFQPLSSGIKLSELSEGEIIKIKESGNPVEFYIAKHDYEIRLNGFGRTLVVRKEVYDQRQWNTSNANAWASSIMRSWLNSTYKAMLDANIQEAMSTTTYYYTPGVSVWRVGTRSDAVFLLSATELGKSGDWINVEGSALPTASGLQIARRNGVATTQWTRSPCTESNSVIKIDTEGDTINENCTANGGSRPAFTLPSTALVDSDNNLIGQ